MIFRSVVPFLRFATTNFLLVVAILSVAPAYGDEPTTGPLAGTTAAHNGVRQALNNGTPPTPGAPVQPVACPSIPDVVWDDAIATTAQNWANQCTCAHEGGTGFGENIAWGGGVDGPGSTVNWADEVRVPGYDYVARDCPPGSPTFPNCGHYTQVAWSTTTAIGCGFASCGVGSGCGVADYVVCRYNPPGNFPAGDGDTLRPYCTATVFDDCQLGAGVCGGGGDQQLTVMIDATGTGTGVVSSNPPGIDCPTTNCVANFPDASEVELTATADGGSSFVSWSGDCLFAGANPVCTITMNGAKNATAKFDTVGNDQTLTVTKDGTGTGTVTSNPAGIDCGITCMANFQDQTMVNLTATADGGSTFFTWGGDCAAFTNNAVCGPITMDAAKNVSATFNMDGPGCQDDAFETTGDPGSGGGTGTDDLCYGTNLGAIPAGPQTHLHCDEDWVYFPAEVGKTYRIETSNLVGGSDTWIHLQNNCGGDLADNDDGAGIGLASAIEWTATVTGFHDVRIRQFDDLYAPGEGYDISVSEVGCPMNLDLTNQMVTDAQTFIAQVQITTGPAFVVSATGNATLTAGTAVVMTEGTSVIGDLTVNLTPNPCPAARGPVRTERRPRT